MNRSHEELEAFDLNLLRVLDVLLRTRGVTRAAAELGLTQSGVSRSLKRLRDQFGDPLLVRDGRHMVPTAVARELMVPVGRLLGDAEMLFIAGRGFDPATVSWSVRIATAGYVEHVLLPPLLERLHVVAPSVDVHMVHGRGDADGLLEGRVDFVINITGSVHGPDLVASPVFGDVFRCVVRRGHPVLKQGLCLQQFLALDHVLIAPGGTAGGHIDEVLAERGLKRRVRAQVSSFAAPMALIVGSDLIVTMPARIASQLGAYWDVELLEPPLELSPFSLSSYWAAHRRTEPAHRWFRGVLSETAAAVRGVI